MTHTGNGHAMDFSNDNIYDLLTRIQKLSKTTVGGEAVDQGLRGAIVGLLNQYCGGDMARYVLLHRLFPGKWISADHATTKDLTPAEWYALWCWLKPYKDDSPTGDLKWHFAPYVNDQIALLFGSPKEW